MPLAVSLLAVSINAHCGRTEDIKFLLRDEEDCGNSTGWGEQELVHSLLPCGLLVRLLVEMWGKMRANLKLRFGWTWVWVLVGTPPRNGIDSFKRSWRAENNKYVAER